MKNKINVNISPNPLDLQTLHCSQNDTGERKFYFTLHNNGEVIDTTDISDPIFEPFDVHKGGTEQLLPVNTDDPSTSPIIADIQYPDEEKTEQEFTYRESPTTIDGKALIEKIKGNTIVWNQLLDKSQYPSTQIINDVTFTNNGDGSITASGTATDNVYLDLVNITTPINRTYAIFTNCNQKGSDSTFELGLYRFTTSGTSHIYEDRIIVKTSQVYSLGTVRFIVRSGVTVNVTMSPQIFDLTTMFGSTKADEIYAMEQSQSGSGVAYFRSLYPLPYYQYTEGKLLSFGTPQQVTFNQMVDAPATSGDYDVQGVNLTYGTNTITLNSGTSTNGFKTAYNRYDLTSGHKYAVWGSPKNSNVNNYYLFIADSTGNTSRKAIFAEPVIYDCQVTENARLYVHVEQGATANHNVFQPQIIDLTVMYGSGKEPSIEYFRQVFNEDYYPYDSGSVVSANVSGIKTVGFNQWDEETTFGYFNITGIWTISNQHISSKNPIPVLPNTTYYCALVNGDAPIYITQWAKPVPSGVSNTESFIKRGVAPSTNNTFVTDPNCHAIHINCGSAYGTTYNNDICINISSDKDGTYEPYIEPTVSIPTSTYFPTGMKDVPSAYDELTNSKAVTRVGERAYQSGDENDPAVKTDGTTTYYALAEEQVTQFTQASLICEDGESTLYQDVDSLVCDCTEDFSKDSGFKDCKIKFSNDDGVVYSNKIQLHIERKP